MDVFKTEEYENWFQKLRDKQAKARINVRIKRLSLDNPGDTRKIGKEVSELRISYGPGYRVYFVQSGEDAVVLLHGGTKQRQQKDIEKAKNLAQNIVVEHKQEEYGSTQKHQRKDIEEAQKSNIESCGRT